MINRREFTTRTAAVAASALGLAPAIAATPSIGTHQLGGPCLPLEHPAYDLLQDLAAMGWETGLPDGSFAGVRPVSRARFAWALRSMYSQVSFFEGGGAQLAPRRTLDTPRLLRALNDELLGEFAAQGVAPALLRPMEARFERLWRSPHPRGVTEPVLLEGPVYSADPLWPGDPRARAEGARLAQGEWRKGEISLHLAEPPQVDVNLPNAISLVHVPEANTDPQVAQILQGHNAEMWRLLRRLGPPQRSRFGWVNDLFHLPRVWSDRDRTPVAIGHSHDHVSPDGLFHWAGNRMEPGNKALIRPQELWGWHRQIGPTVLHPFALIWGEPGSGIAYFRSRGGYRDRHLVRLFAVDLRTQIILNAAVA